jgi:hypothetical protein
MDREVRNGEDVVVGKVVAQQNNIGVASIDYINHSLNDLKVEGKDVKIVMNHYLFDKIEAYKK